MKKSKQIDQLGFEWGERWSNMSWVGIWTASNITPHRWQEIILNFHFLVARHWLSQANIRAAHFDSH